MISDSVTFILESHLRNLGVFKIILHKKCSEIAAADNLRRACNYQFPDTARADHMSCIYNGSSIMPIIIAALFDSCESFVLICMNFLVNTLNLV